MNMEEIYAAGEVRLLGGCSPRRHEVGSLFAAFQASENATVIPRSQWQTVSLRGMIAEIMDQDGQGACNAFAAVQSLHGCRAMEGLPFVQLSPGNLYGRINGGQDGGSSLGDALAALRDEGVCTAKTIGPLHWDDSGRNPWPESWRDEATKFRILEAFDCPTFDHIASALQCGFFVDYGVFVGRNFEPDSSGVIPRYRGGSGGHAMCGVGLTLIDDVWHVETANSWGKDWGDAGFCYVPESYFEGDFNDAWAVRASTWQE